MSSAIGDCDHIVTRDLRDVDDLEDTGGDLLDTCRQLLAIGTLDLDLREHRGGGRLTHCWAEFNL